MRDTHGSWHALCFEFSASQFQIRETPPDPPPTKLAAGGTRFGVQRSIFAYVCTSLMFTLDLTHLLPMCYNWLIGYFDA